MIVKRFNETYTTYTLSLTNGIDVSDERNKGGSVIITNKNKDGIKYSYIPNNNGYEILVDLSISLDGNISSQIKYTKLIKDISETIREIRKFIDSNRVTHTTIGTKPDIKLGDTIFRKNNSDNTKRTYRVTGLNPEISLQEIVIIDGEEVYGEEDKLDWNSAKKLNKIDTWIWEGIF